MNEQQQYQQWPDPAPYEPGPDNNLRFNIRIINKSLLLYNLIPRQNQKGREFLQVPPQATAQAVQAIV